MRYDVAVSIINYKTADMTLTCVQSALDDLEGYNACVVITDNQSQDGSVEKIEAWIAARPEGIPVILVKSETNSGFSGGNNQGFAACDAAFYLVLNSDAYIKPGFFKALLDAAETQPNVGFFAPRIDFEEGGTQNSCFRFHSPAGEFLRCAKMRLFERILPNRSVTLGPDPDRSQIQWASFACLLLRAEMMQQIGPMDEGYFLYFEDSEYCLRGYRAGWPVAYVPNARAVHLRGGSGPVKSLEKRKSELPRYFYAARTRFFYQAYGRLGLLSANLCWYLGRICKHAARLLGGKDEGMSAREWRNIWTNFGDPLGPGHDPRVKE